MTLVDQNFFYGGKLDPESCLSKCYWENEQYSLRHLFSSSNFSTLFFSDRFLSLAFFISVSHRRDDCRASRSPLCRASASKSSISFSREMSWLCRCKILRAPRQINFRNTNDSLSGSRATQLARAGYPSRIFPSSMSPKTAEALVLASCEIFTGGAICSAWCTLWALMTKRTTYVDGGGGSYAQLRFMYVGLRSGRRPLLFGSKWEGERWGKGSALLTNAIYTLLFAWLDQSVVFLWAAWMRRSPWPTIFRMLSHAPLMLSYVTSSASLLFTPLNTYVTS